jgi:hypothetical protein
MAEVRALVGAFFDCPVDEFGRSVLNLPATSRDQWDEEEDDDGTYVSPLGTDDEGRVKYTCTTKFTRADYQSESDSDESYDEEHAEEMAEIDPNPDELPPLEIGSGFMPLSEITQDDARNELLLIARDLGLPERAIRRSFEYWLTGTIPDASSPEATRNLHVFWTRLGTDDNGQPHALMGPLSRVALRLLSVPCSEAAVERVIWHQRRILCPGSLRMSQKTEEERARFIVSAMDYG